MDDQIHILAFPFPITGHMNSTMHLCISLVSWFNVKVTYVSSSTNYDLAVHSRNLAAHGREVSLSNIQVVSFPQPPDLTFPEQAVANWMRSHLETLLDGLTPQPVCILTDTLNGWVQDVANKFSIPRAVFWTSSARTEIMHVYASRLFAEGYVPIDPEAAKVVDFLPGIPPFPATELPLAFNSHETVPFVHESSVRYPEAKYALCNTFEELEPEVIGAYREHIRSTYFPVGPCLAPAFLSTDADWKSNSALSEGDVRCLAWLDKQSLSSVIYVSFGTMAKLSAGTLQEIAAGLELSEQPFLLVKRKDVVESTSPEFEEFFGEFEERNREKGLVTRWAPQMLVLLHPAVGGFLTHCGWNSTLESISASVPMLAWPCLAEQNVNCSELVRRRKIALEVKDASRQHISGLVLKLLTGEEGKEMKRRAGELSEAAKVAASEGGSTYKNLKAFVNALQGEI